MSKVTAHRQIACLRYLREEERSSFAPHLERLNNLFLEICHVESLSLSLSYVFTADHDSRIRLYVSAAIDEGVGDPTELLDYIDRCFDIFSLARTPVPNEEIVDLHSALPNSYHVILNNQWRNLATPGLAVQKQDLVQMSEKLINCSQECILKISLHALPRRYATSIMPTLHKVGTFFDLQGQGHVKKTIPLNWLNMRPEEYLSYEYLLKSLFHFSIEIHSKNIVEDRIFSIIRHGFGKAFAPHLSLKSMNNEEPGNNGIPEMKHPADILQGIVHAANAGSIFQFPLADRFSPYFQIEKPSLLPPPPGTYSEGIKLGVIDYFSKDKDLCVSEADLTRHAYICGKTGTGKSTVLKSMILSSIQLNKQGVILLDPHGDLSIDILQSIPPEHEERVVYIDFSDTDFFPGINIFENSNDREMEFAIGETDAFFLSMYGPEIWGPRIQDAYRNFAQLLCLDTEDGGGTLLDLLWAINLEDNNIKSRFEKIAAKTNRITLRIILLTVFRTGS